MAKKKEVIQTLPALVAEMVATNKERDVITGKVASLELKREQLEEEAATLEKRNAELQLREEKIDAALTEAAKKSKLSIPKVVRQVVAAMLRGVESFAPEKLEVRKPTPTDPIVVYQGITILWYLEV